jgi:hypothetical protein
MVRKEAPSFQRRLIISSYLPVVFFICWLITSLFTALIHFQYIEIPLTRSATNIIFVCGFLLASCLIILAFLSMIERGINLTSRLFSIPTNEINTIRKQQKYFRFIKILILLSFLLIFFAFVNQKFEVANLDAATIRTDTNQYQLTASRPLDDIYFWSGFRPFTLPLLFKITNCYEESCSVSNVSQIQIIISIFSWTCLAISICGVMKHWFSKIIAFATILFISTAIDITAWDRILLAESISTSMFVLLLALFIYAGMQWAKRRTLPVWLRILVIGAILLIAILYSFSRDTNAYFLLFIGTAMLVGFFFSLIRKHPLFSSYLAVGVGLLVLFVLQFISVNVAQRSFVPAMHIVVYRVIPESEKLDFFIAHGMPYDDANEALPALTHRQLSDAIYHNMAIQNLVNWVLKNGTNVTMLYLVSHPIYTLTAPFNDLQAIINGQLTAYRENVKNPSTFIRFFSKIAYPRFAWLPELFLVLLIIAGWQFIRTKERRTIWIIVMFLFISAFPLAIITWQGDTIEIERHAFQVAFQLRLVAWMLILLFIDHGVNYFQSNTKKEKNISSSN